MTRPTAELLADELLLAWGVRRQFGKDDPVLQLGGAIAGRGQCLVVLDNFEQVVEAAPDLAALLAAACGDKVPQSEAAKKIGNSPHARPSFKLLTSPACEHDESALSRNEVSRKISPIVKRSWWPALAAMWLAASWWA